MVAALVVVVIVVVVVVDGYVKMLLSKIKVLILIVVTITQSTRQVKTKELNNMLRFEFSCVNI